MPWELIERIGWGMIIVGGGGLILITIPGAAPGLVGGGRLLPALAF